jgi:hypothetical protein
MANRSCPLLPCEKCHHHCHQNKAPHEERTAEQASNHLTWCRNRRPTAAIGLVLKQGEEEETLCVCRNSSKIQDSPHFHIANASRATSSKALTNFASTNSFKAIR